MANYVQQSWTDGVSSGSAARFAYMETGIYDAHFQPAARAVRTTTQTIANNTLTAVSFNAETFDTDTIHSTSSNPTRLTCKTAGYYSVRGFARFDASATGYREALLRVNGTTGYAYYGSVLPAAFDSNYVSVQSDTLISMAVNDYVEFMVAQTSGGNLNLLVMSGEPYNHSPYFEMFRVG